jgi:hypothetical protein
MADLTVTAANVISGAGAKIINGKSGETIVAGKVVYFDSADSKYKLADNNSATAAVRVSRWYCSQRCIEWPAHRRA